MSWRRWGTKRRLRIRAAALTAAVVVDKMSQLNEPITASLAAEIDRRIRALPDQRTESIRRIRREFSEQLRGASADEVLALAQTLVERQRWVAYELLYHHPSGLSVLDVEQVERLGRGIDN